MTGGEPPDWISEYLRSTGITSAIETAIERSGLTDAVRQAASSISEDVAAQRAEWLEQLSRDVSPVHGALGAALAQIEELKTFSLPLTAMGGLAEQMRELHQLTQSSWSTELVRQQSDLADWTRDMFGPSAVSSWCDSLAIETRVSELLAGPVLAAQSSLAADLQSITEKHVSLTEWAVRQNVGTGVLGARSGRPLGVWRTRIDELSEVSSPADLQSVLVSGQTGLGLLGADALDSVGDDTELLPLAVERVEADVLEPWGRGHLGFAGELYARLGGVDPSVPELLYGAWEDLERNGPAAASKAAHCAVETLDRMLRAAAPDDAVLSWHRETGRSTKELTDRGSPTRALRVRFLASQIGGTKEVIIAQYESLTKLLSPLHGRLEGVKHASTGDVVLVRSLLMTAESFLALLFLQE